VTAFPSVEDSLVVGQKVGDDERVIMFCKMASGITFTRELEQDIRTKIRDLLSSRHVPSIIMPIADIPVISRKNDLPKYTLTGKKVEVAVKKIISGVKFVASLDTFMNPESLQLYYNLTELKSKI